MVYQNANEWVRVHMREIVTYYRDKESVDLDSYLGLTPGCYDYSSVCHLGNAGWDDTTNETFGTMQRVQ